MAVPTTVLPTGALVILDPPPPPDDGGTIPEPTIVIVLPLTGPSSGFRTPEITTDGGALTGCPEKVLVYFSGMSTIGRIVVPPVAVCTVTFARPLYLSGIAAICIHYSKRYIVIILYRVKPKRHQRVFRTAFLAVRTSRPFFTTAL